MDKIITEDELRLELEDYRRLCERKYNLISEGGNWVSKSDSIVRASANLKQAEFFLTLDLHEQLRYALSLAMFTNQSFFLTGKPGTGKSVFLDVYRSITKKNLGIAAPTGVAAVNVGGMTLNSLFGLGYSFHGEWYYHNEYGVERTEKPHLEISRNRATMLFNMESLAIDEISMTRSDTLDAVSSCFQIIRGNHNPFGGVQVICIGDPFQLPPIADTEIKAAYKSEGYLSEFFFHSKQFNASRSKKIEFTKVYRQDEKEFLDVLDKVRFNSLEKDDYRVFNVTPKIPNEKVVSLCSTNKAAKEINDQKFYAISSPAVHLKGDIVDKFPPSMMNVPQDLYIKKGERVILLQNNWNQGFVNGDTGTVVGIDWKVIRVEFGNGGGFDRDAYCVEVKLDNGKTVDVPQGSWQNVEREWDDKTRKMGEKILGEYRQHPIAPAWAITIHKSQGKTFDQVFIDFGRGTFSHGQAYVALSRCRTLGGMYLKKDLKPEDILVDSRVIQYLRGEVTIDVDQFASELERFFENLCDMAESQEEFPFKSEDHMHDFLFKVSERVLSETLKEPASGVLV